MKLYVDLFPTHFSLHFLYGCIHDFFFFFFLSSTFLCNLLFGRLRISRVFKKIYFFPSPKCHINVLQDTCRYMVRAINFFFSFHSFFPTLYFFFSLNKVNVQCCQFFYQVFFFSFLGVLVCHQVKVSFAYTFLLLLLCILRT